MNKFNNIDEFENLFKQQAQTASTPPPIGGWEAVSSGLGSGSAGIGGSTGLFSSVSGIIKVALFVGGALATVGILYQSNKPENKPTPTSQTGIISEVPQEDASSETYNETAVESLDVSDKNDKNAIPTSSNPTTENRSINKPPANTKFEEASPLTGGTSPTKVIEANEKTSKAEEATLRLAFSNYKPCKGEIIELTNNRNVSGNWFVNGKQIAGNTGKTNYKCVDSKEIKVKFVSDQFEASKTLSVSSLKANLFKRENPDGSHTFWLSDNGLISNWYVDDKLVSTNAPSLNYAFMEVGKHQVKAVPVNHACSAELIHDVVIEPTGKIEIDNIFTPNGDGKNDVYQVRIENYTNFSIQIFTSKLVKVFASNDPNEAWNGKINNQEHECADGEYIARISYQLKGEKPVIKNVRLRLNRNNNN